MMQTSRRYANTRQKSCQQCSDAKARCNRERTGCARCIQRGLACAYPQVTAQSSELRPGASIPSPFSDSSADSSTLTQATASHFAEEEVDTRPGLDFERLCLVCPIDAERVRNRWLNPYLEQPDQVVKAYPPMITRYISRVLGSYAAMAAHGRSAPPFIHPAQMHTPGAPLATCLSLARVSDDPLLPGSIGNAASILRREMDSVAAQDQDDGGTDDAATALDAFQAYLIYVLVLFFRLNQGVAPFFRGAMTILQGLACVAARTGLVCAADASRARPRWEEWIVAEAKRRTLYIMYLLDSVLSDQENLPTYLGTELRGLPAPSSKALWQAPTRAAWEREYNVFQAEWSEPHLTIDELWPTPQGMEDASVAQRRRRVDRWLQDLDEFGTMLFAVTGCTHGA